MALLLNRKYGSRLECLYYILKVAEKRFGDLSFDMKDFKFDEDAYNVHNECKLLKTRMGITFCPYLDNPLNSSKCYATQSTLSDSTKQKAVSDVSRSLEALGFIEFNEKKWKITSLGHRWINTDFETSEWLDISTEAVLSYGVVIGFLHIVSFIPDYFNMSKIYLGYPNTENPEELSSESTKDSNTRTVSKIVSWCLTTGLIEPKDFTQNDNILPQNAYREIVNADKFLIRLFRITNKGRRVFNAKLIVKNPLSYVHLNKNVGSIRERGSEEIRLRTIENNHRIINRRFIFVYVLNKLSMLNKDLDLNKFINQMSKYYNDFFMSGSDVTSIIQSESSISFICGLPFTILNSNIISPTTIINHDILVEGAPYEILTIGEKILSELL